MILSLADLDEESDAISKDNNNHNIHMNLSL